MITVRRLAPGEALADVDLLYRRVFGLAATDSGMNPRLLVAIASTGGHVVGAFDDATLVGYGLALLARDDGTDYHYSQTVAVDAAYRGRGIGRAVKDGQRTASLAMGIDTLRWAYDPVQARNAHLNLDVLGGEVHRFVRDLYGTAAPGNDAGERTDRCIVTWSLTATPRPPAPVPPPVEPGAVVADPPDTLLGVPTEWDTFRRSVGSRAAAQVRERVAAAFGDLLGRGAVARSCVRVDDAAAVYRFSPAAAR